MSVCVVEARCAIDDDRPFVCMLQLPGRGSCCCGSPARDNRKAPWGPRGSLGGESGEDDPRRSSKRDEADSRRLAQLGDMTGAGA